jgi:hypothetical protein
MQMSGTSTGARDWASCVCVSVCVFGASAVGDQWSERVEGKRCVIRAGEEEGISCAKFVE